jgi:hypothetical protein
MGETYRGGHPEGANHLGVEHSHRYFRTASIQLLPGKTILDSGEVLRSHADRLLHHRDGGEGDDWRVGLG